MDTVHYPRIIKIFGVSYDDMVEARAAGPQYGSAAAYSEGSPVAIRVLSHAAAARHSFLCCQRKGYDQSYVSYKLWLPTTPGERFQMVAPAAL